MTDTPVTPTEPPQAPEPAASTADEQDHENVDQFRGADADPPADTGKPPEQDTDQDGDQAAEPV